MGLFLAGLSGLADDPLVHVLDAFALVRLRWADGANLGRLVADKLLVCAADGDLGVVLNREGDTFWGIHLHWMAVAGTDHQLLALDLGPVANADDFQFLGVALRDPFNHVGHEGAAKAVALA